MAAVVWMRSSAVTYCASGKPCLSANSKMLKRPGFYRPVSAWSTLPSSPDGRGSG